MRQIPYNTPGMCDGIGLHVSWQQGPIVDGRANGSTVEQVIRAAIYRLDDLEAHLPHSGNRAAIDCLYTALARLEERTRDRAARGVMGTSER